jgi:hypothetical protein
MNESRKPNTQEKVALAAAAGILIATVIYWISQIIGVIEMLQLAYGS